MIDSHKQSYTFLTCEKQQNNKSRAMNFKSAVVTVLKRENILTYKGPNYFQASAVL